MKASSSSLRSLKAAIVQLAAHTDDTAETDLNRRAALSLVNALLVNQLHEPELILKFYSSIEQLLPALSQVLPAQGATLAPFCKRAQVGEFERFCSLVRDAQQSLMELSTVTAQGLAANIVRIEGSLAKDLVAVNDRFRAENDLSQVSGVMNARAYDETALLEYIRRVFPEERALQIDKSGFVAGGFSKFTMDLQLSGVRDLPESMILRADAQAAFGGHRVSVEYELLSNLFARGVRVPEPFALEPTGEVFGSPLMLLAKRPGTIIGGPHDLPSPNPRVCRSIAENLVLLHQIPLEDFGDKLTRLFPKNSDKVLAWLDQGYQAWQPLGYASPVMETAFAWLRENALLNDRAPRTLVHGDYGLHNLLIEEDAVSAILDWEFANAGDPTYDLAYFYYQAQALDSWEDFLSAYEKAGGVLADEAQMNYNLLLASTRLTVMIFQAKKGFELGQSLAPGTAVVIGEDYPNQGLERIAECLERVL